MTDPITRGEQLGFSADTVREMQAKYKAGRTISDLCRGYFATAIEIAEILGDKMMKERTHGQNPDRDLPRLGDRRRDR